MAAATGLKQGVELGQRAPQDGDGAQCGQGASPAATASAQRRAGKRRRVARQPLQIHAVEDHDEVLGPVHRALGSRLLPFHGNAVVHFDAHPDLLLPPAMAAELVFDKAALREHASVASWLLPLAYAGHVASIVWLKPSWARQIPDGTHAFVVGRRRDTGTLSTDCRLPYWEDELLCHPTELLLDAKPVTLVVVTVQNGWGGGIGSGSGDVNSASASTDLADTSSPPTAHNGNARAATDGVPLERDAVEVVGAVLRAAPPGGVVLDVCLDFFSARNPFRVEVDNGFFTLLSRLYAAHSATSAAFQACLARRPDARARFLVRMAAALATRPDEAGTPERFAQLLHGASECCGEPRLRDVALRELHRRLVDVHARAPPGAAVNPQRLADIGATTDLPHHESTAPEVDALFGGLRRWLAEVVALQAPAIVTLARSAADGYTPIGAADELQRRVVAEVRAACGASAEVVVHTADDGDEASGGTSCDSGLCTPKTAGRDA